MAKHRKAAAAAKTPEDWVRWSVQLPPGLIWDLKIAAAQNRQPIREALRAAIEAYVEASQRAG